MKYILIALGFFLLTISCTKITPETEIMFPLFGEITAKILLNDDAYANDIEISDDGTIWVAGYGGIYSMKNSVVKKFVAIGTYNSFTKIGLLNNEAYFFNHDGILNIIENDSIKLFKTELLRFGYGVNFVPLERGMIMGNTYFDRIKWKSISGGSNLQLSRYGFAFPNYIESTIKIYNESSDKLNSFSVQTGDPYSSQNILNKQSINNIGKLYYAKREVESETTQIIELDVNSGTTNQFDLNIPGYHLINNVSAINITATNEIIVIANCYNGNSDWVCYNYTTNKIEFITGFNAQMFIQKNGTIWCYYLNSNTNNYQLDAYLMGNKIANRTFLGSGIAFADEDAAGNFWFGTYTSGYNIDLVEYKNGTFINYWNKFYNSQGINSSYPGAY